MWCGWSCWCRVDNGRYIRTTTKTRSFNHQRTFVCVNSCLFTLVQSVVNLDTNSSFRIRLVVSVPGQRTLIILTSLLTTLQLLLPENAILTVWLDMPRLSPQSRHAARELTDAGLLGVDARGLRLVRLPTIPELCILRRALGLDRRSDDQ